MNDKRDERGRFSSKEEETGYGFYSKVLNRPFDSVQELKEAEAKHFEKQQLELKQADEKKARAKEVENAYKNALDVRKECAAKIREADAAYEKLLNEFIKDYKYFHMSYSDSNGREIVTVSDIIDSFFKNIF